MPGRKFNLIELKDYREKWNNVCTEMMSDREKILFINKKECVDMYIDGKSLADIQEKTGIKMQNISRLIERCIQINPITEEQYGYAALLPYKRTGHSVSTQNTSTHKSRGAFNNLLLTYPQLSLFIKNVYFNTSSKIFSKYISIANLHDIFLEECKKLGIQDYEYPFNTRDYGKRSLYRYVNLLQNNKIDLAQNRLDMNSRKKLLSTGTENVIRPTPIAPYSVIQIDGHKIDMLYTVEVLNKHGEIIDRPAMRLWLIAVVDVATRAILGYHISTNENYNQYDILKAIRNSIMPKKKIEFKNKGLNYPENMGFPSYVFDELKWALPETIMLDNAKSHLAKNVIKKLCEELHCSLNYGSVATPETRGIVERLFGTLEQKGYHLLPSTTGSNINDIKRVDAEKNAIKYKITENDIHELTEYFIATYNNSPHSALDNQTPLECMERRIRASGMFPFVAEGNLRRYVYDLTNLIECKKIRGNISQGKRPYITYKGVEYRNEILSQSPGLIGSELILEINPDDIRTIKSYFSSGEEFGILTATGEWGRKSHSLKTREEVQKMKNENKNNHSPFYAPLAEYEEELKERAETERRARTKSARIRKEQNKCLKPSTKATITNISDSKTHSENLYKVDDVVRKERISNENLDDLFEAGSLEEAFAKGII